MHKIGLIYFSHHSVFSDTFSIKLRKNKSFSSVNKMKTLNVKTQEKTEKKSSVYLPFMVFRRIKLHYGHGHIGQEMEY